MLKTISSITSKQTPVLWRMLPTLTASLMVVSLSSCAYEANKAALGSDTDTQFGVYGTQTALILAQDYAGRYMGSDTERAAAQYMMQQMTFDHDDNIVTLQPFEFTASHGALKGQTLSSQNVIVTHEGMSETGRTLYVGAHYDSAMEYPNYIELEGLDDNASGVGVLRELVYRFGDINTEDTIKFIAFGAEEGGLKGSQAFVDSLSEEEIQNAIGMINLDSLLTGDYMYANSGTNSYDAAGDEIPTNVALRNEAHRIADKLNIELLINPAIIAEGKKKPYKPYGVGCCSDHESFEDIMPVVVFEATNWSLGPNFDGYTQTDNPKIPDGFTWHNPDMDNKAVLVDAFGEARIEQRMHDYTAIVTQLIAKEVGAEDMR